MIGTEDRSNRDPDDTGTTPAGGQQHGSSTGDGGTVGPPSDVDDDGPHHPRPDVLGSRVEDQADQPGVTTEDDR